MRLLTAVIALTLVAGCAPTTSRYSPTAPPPSDADMVDANLPVRCKEKDQCDRWWRAAQVWVVKNSGYKVQVATDAIIQTYNPTPSGHGWAFSVTRGPHLDGGEEFEVGANCGQSLACFPAYETAIADFKRTLLGTR